MVALRLVAGVAVLAALTGCIPSEVANRRSEAPISITLVTGETAQCRRILYVEGSFSFTECLNGKEYWAVSNVRINNPAEVKFQ